MKDFLAGICVGAAVTVLAGIACAVLMDDDKQGEDETEEEEACELEAAEEEEDVCPDGVPVTT